jgi:hypothetical protein
MSINVTGLLRLTLHIVRENSPDGITDERLDQLSGRRLTLRPRRVQLTEWGLVYDSGRTETNLSGKEAILWAAFPPSKQPWKWRRNGDVE